MVVTTNGDLDRSSTSAGSPGPTKNLNSHKGHKLFVLFLAAFLDFSIEQLTSTILYRTRNHGITEGQYRGEVLQVVQVHSSELRRV
ncbi:hypothetical protein PUN28_014288 [Cardiocondyla obscurior]|uniref:Uncharacterized protein n=1 Tax=Cardiocondyla obscurior TaxID=286306 RepID=A0AAW2F0N1_9HYME